MQADASQRAEVQGDTTPVCRFDEKSSAEQQVDILFDTQPSTINHRNCSASLDSQTLNKSCHMNDSVKHVLHPAKPASVNPLKSSALSPTTNFPLMETPFPSILPSTSECKDPQEESETFLFSNPENRVAKDDDRSFSPIYQTALILSALVKQNIRTLVFGKVHS